MTAEEIEHLAAALKPVVNPDLCALAYVNDEPVGFALGLPEYNQALRHVNGRLFPFGIFKLLWYRRRINAIRVLTLGLRPAFRQRGFDAALITHIFIHAGKRGQARGECSWILEDNVEMRNGLERLGGHAYKTYRVYEKSF
jgi:GNAT superfamily N-acetyltransferase